MEAFPVLPLTRFTLLNLFGLLEWLSSHVADFNACNKSLIAKLLQQAIGIINFEILSPNFIADTMNWFLNSMLD